MSNVERLATLARAFACARGSAQMLIDRLLIVEVKPTERLAAVHSRQVLTYLRLLGLPLGLLMNFGGETFREGLRRVMNDQSRPTGQGLSLEGPDRASGACAP